MITLCSAVYNPVRILTSDCYFGEEISHPYNPLRLDWNGVVVRGLKPNNFENGVKRKQQGLQESMASTSKRQIG